MTAPWSLRHILLAASMAVLLTGPAFAQYHQVQPYNDRNGVFHQGHLQGNPDGDLYNNVRPPSQAQIERHDFPTMNEGFGPPRSHHRGGLFGND